MEYLANKILRHISRLSLPAAVALVCSTAYAQPSEKMRVTTHAQLGVNLVREDNLFWNLAETFASQVDYSANTEWLELYAKPGVRFEQKGEGHVFYGNASVVASATLGTDAYDTGDTGRLTLEEAYLGIKTDSDSRLNWDFSIGARELKLGSGMLIANGATSGFERGAIKLGPRKAWERTAIVRALMDKVTITGFYLDPNELESNDTETKLAGFDISMPLPSKNSLLGFTYGHLLDSGSPYAKAPENGVGVPSIIDGGRENLSFVSHYGLTDVAATDTQRYFVQWDAAYQWNDDIDMRAWGGRIKLGTTWLSHTYKPTLTYSWQTFSGDDPYTDRLERFDPLYYEGSPAAWSTGSKSSMVFINSNVQSHQFGLGFYPSEKHIVNVRAAHIRVNELNSPIQFGQASRLDFSDGLSTVITGVTDGHLADDFFVEYTYLMSQTTFVTVGVSLSKPGDGINKALGSEGPNWSGGFVNIVMYL
jgi:hypothetical protein